MVRNPLRPLLSGEELDELPFADRELLYAAHVQSRRTKIKPIITGRGCPYDCAFCFNKAYSDLYGGKGRRFRRRSPDNVLRELKEVTANHDVRFILFMDDTFILQDKWLHEFMTRYKAEIGLPFWCQVRANLVTDEKIALFKDAGCVSVSFGLEAGNDELRNAVLNRNMSREEILGAAEILRRHDIAFMTNNMLGLPTGNLETDFETLELNAQCRPAYANVFLFQPYPKTGAGRVGLRAWLDDGHFRRPVGLGQRRHGHQVRQRGGKAPDRESAKAVRPGRRVSPAAAGDPPADPPAVEPAFLAGLQAVEGLGHQEPDVPLQDDGPGIPGFGAVLHAHQEPVRQWRVPEEIGQIGEVTTWSEANDLPSGLC